VQTALNGLASGQSYIIPCGTYTGPALSGLSNVSLIGLGGQENTSVGNEYAISPNPIVTCVTFTYATNLTMTNSYNDYIKGITFDFLRGGFGFSLNTSSMNNFDNLTIRGAGSAAGAIPAFQIKTNGSTSAFNSAHNHFRGFKVEALDLTSNGIVGIKVIGAGTPNTGAISTDNSFQMWKSLAMYRPV